MTPTLPATGDMIACDNLVRIYSVADVEVVALQGLDLRIRTGEMVAIVGASGSGKSTLLNILGGLDVPTAGRALVDGQDLAHLSRRERTRYRRTTVGMVWQQTSRNLLPHLDVTSNVALPMVLDHRSNRDQRAEELLELVGLSERARHRPAELSGGEQQRVAIAVALANGPSVLLADEPTGELDEDTSDQVADLFDRVHADGTSIVVVTHNPVLAARAKRRLTMKRGTVVVA
jgi:ABC-type lipoprotein export system ATPase subunit